MRRELLDKATRRLMRREPGDDRALRETGLHPLLARTYAARGVTDPALLNLDLAGLLSPDRLLHVDRAAQRLAQALREGESLLLVGDFDADGATSCALAVRALRAFGGTRVDYLVPNRFDYGYGLSPEIVALARERSPDLIITVDNGISSVDGVAAAVASGIDVLVTDHHLPGEVTPAAGIIVNPNQPDCNFPSKHLAGVGVIFYVMLALRRHLRELGWFEQQGLAIPHLGQFLDLVALGTVADVVPLDHNNRILVQAGLQRIRAGRACAGIRALLEVAGRRAAGVVASDLGFAVGPRLNAAGRLDDMSIGIECLLADDESVASGYARRLDQLNRDRRLIERGMQDEALRLLGSMQIDRLPVPAALALYEPGWHQGVVGILASRIKERLHRPVVAFADAEEGELKGSARSIPGVHIRDVLAAIDARHPGLIGKFGGHAMAAGLSLPASALSDFAQALSAEVERVASAEDLEALLHSDGGLAAAEFDVALAEELRLAGPWGQHFPEPVFDGCFDVMSQRLVGERHLKLVLRVPGSDRLLDAIAFNIDPAIWPDPEAQSLSLVYRLDVNEFRGQRSLQLVVQHLTVVPAADG
ncbi:MAG: single-stranded-DNA-specific exonuclease RecJ [Chromatocurvus sp.]